MEKLYKKQTNKLEEINQLLMSLCDDLGHIIENDNDFKRAKQYEVELHKINSISGKLHDIESNISYFKK